MGREVRWANKRTAFLLDSDPKLAEKSATAACQIRRAINVVMPHTGWQFLAK
jgi:hypothetical protein